MKPLSFVWGPGGVGKSHVAIRETCYAPEEKRLLLTLDPSHRLFHLLGASPSTSRQEIEIGRRKFYMKATEANELFEKLHKENAAPDSVRIYFQQLVSGLQRFQDYLCLIELAEEIHNTEFDRILIDTPPFSEAIGLHQSIHSLSEFFQKSIVQLSQRGGWMNLAVKKLIDVAGIFAGKKALENSLEFIDWLHLHLDRFQLAAKELETMVFAPTTEHIFVLTPESSKLALESTQDFFKKSNQLRFIINKSVADFELANAPRLLEEEFLLQRSKERSLSESIETMFPESSITKLPLQVMGTDAQEELLQFIGPDSEAEKTSESGS